MECCRGILFLRLLTFLCFFHFSGLNNGMEYWHSMAPAQPAESILLVHSAVRLTIRCIRTPSAILDFCVDFMRWTARVQSSAGVVIKSNLKFNLKVRFTLKTFEGLLRGPRTVAPSWVYQREEHQFLAALDSLGLDAFGFLVALPLSAAWLILAAVLGVQRGRQAPPYRIVRRLAYASEDPADLRDRSSTEIILFRRMIFLCPGNAR